MSGDNVTKLPVGSPRAVPDDHLTVGKSMTGGGGGNGGGPMDPIFEERIRRSEAEMRVEQTRLEGKLDLILSKLDDLKDDIDNTRGEVSSNKWQLATLGVAMVALLMGVWAYSTQMTELAVGIAGVENGQESPVGNSGQ